MKPRNCRLFDKSHRHPDVLKFAADALIDQGEWSQARNLLTEAASAYVTLGDRAGEAVTWGELAMLLKSKDGPCRASLHLAAIAWIILKDIGSANQKTALTRMDVISAELGLTPHVLNTEIHTAFASCQ